MRILVVDDDWLIRFTMISMLNQIGEFIITEASNGVEMVAKFKETQPALVFVDIEMPLMDGLEAIKVCQEIHQAKFVIVSSYSDFTYAKKGIQLGIHDYLIKPLEVSKLEEIMIAIKDKIMDQSKETNFKFQLSVANLINYYPHIDVEEEFRDDGLIKDYSYLSIVSILRGLGNGHAIDTIQEAIDQLFSQVAESIIRNKHGFCTNLLTSGGHSMMVIYAHKETLTQIIIEFQSLLISLRQKNMVANLVYTIRDSIYDTQQVAVFMDDYNLVVSEHHNFSLVPFENVYSHEELLFLFNLDQLIKYIENDDMGEIHTKRNELCDILKRSHISLKEDRITSYLKNVFQIPVDLNTIIEVLDFVIDDRVAMRRKEMNKGDSLIDTIKLYIEQNYMNDVSVSLVAEKHNLTPNYLSSIFHQYTGRKFIDFLTELRMFKASELLISKPNTTISDVAIMVGYNSARHFSTLFQKNYNMTPTQFRKINFTFNQ